ncbi:CDP-diacylglycerol diphosphatase [Providencia rettgeri]|nr:CDP-diacylglycerol diphosphatase [Providencia rettgeri]EJD6642548.1 CDP-diacylglycerol diphosphatase [Providencia rettgeri]ELL9152156.1 CDP-diacylglycerol diphosphatase [Providencia rettgeri]ELR5047186.1 CDP-diacylglycerol diphosphatase [Providencia rettgeri]ELR5059804.1 CDP-diacylglycerol diphosphatase [Providencia rettgeri]
MLKNKWVKLFLGLFFLLLAIIIGYISWIKLNANALWNIINSQCIPQQQTHSITPPCLKVDTENQYVLFKDKKGPLHNLVIPISKVKGIEAKQLITANVPNYFALAWQERASLLQQSKKEIPDDLLAIAVNSQYGRSQDQLHIHLACLKQEVHQKLNQFSSTITTDWAFLPTELVGHHYLAKKLQSEFNDAKNPFNQLYDYVVKHHDEMGNYGLAMVQLKDGSKVLLANRLDITELNLGSAGEILDYQCLANQ